MYFICTNKNYVYRRRAQLLLVKPGGGLVELVDYLHQGDGGALSKDEDPHHDRNDPPDC